MMSPSFCDHRSQKSCVVYTVTVEMPTLDYTDYKARPLLDQAPKWTGLFPLESATAEACAKILIDDVFLWYCTCRKFVSDNGVEFISDMMQKVTYCFCVNTPFIPLYHVFSGTKEQRYQEDVADSCTQRAWYLGWISSELHYAFSSMYTSATNYSPAFLCFGRQIQYPYDYDFCTSRQFCSSDYSLLYTTFVVSAPDGSEIGHHNVSDLLKVKPQLHFQLLHRPVLLLMFLRFFLFFTVFYIYFISVSILYF